MPSAPAPKTVNNVLTVLSIAMRSAVEWEVMPKASCAIRMLRTPKTTASCHDFDEFERLVRVTRTERLAHLLVLLAGKAGLRGGEMMALDWADVDRAATVRGAVRMEGPRDDAEGRAAAVRAVDRVRREDYNRFSLARSPAMSASFLARVHRFSWRSRARARRRSSYGSACTSETGRRDRVNPEAVPSSCLRTRRTTSLVSPTYSALSAQRRM